MTVDPETTTIDFTTSTASASNDRARSEGSESTGEKVDENRTAEGDAEKATKKTASRVKDPIRMFGILNIPSSLRTAQSEAIKMVDIIPQLVSVDTQMKEIEIQIRRARKYRAKAEAAERSETSLQDARESLVTN